MKRKWVVLLVLIEVWGCDFRSSHQNNLTAPMPIKEFISSLPQEERFFLEYFFRCLIQEDSMGYVLLGGKPMSLYSYLQPKVKIYSHHAEPLKYVELFFMGFAPEDALFQKGLEVWKRYEKYFCGRNIFFDAFERDEKLRYMRVSVMNKRMMQALLNKHLYQFRKWDSSVNDLDSLWFALLHNPKFKTKFYSRDDLLGLCLGYGKRNALLFYKLSALLTSMGQLNFTLEKPSPERLETLSQECALLKKTFVVGVKDHRPSKFRFNIGLGFRADFSDPETLALQEKYALLHTKLTQVYVSGDFLEKTLELIRLADSS